MTSSALDGLTALLEKSPIIPTFKARDFLTIPADVEVTYERHVRTHLPLARISGDDDAPDVATFEQRLLRLIRDAKAPTGYVAAEYGHGKTSTGLFLWDRARAAGVLAVPPFSLDRLEDLLVAVTGWVRFAVERVAPGLGAEVDAIYETYHAEGVESLARRQAVRFERPYEQVLAELRALDQLGRLQSAADGLTYVNFLEAITAVAHRAGFQGLLIVADEVQQYIEHADVANATEPIGRLFDLITTMLSRTGRLACGLIFLLPNKELGLLNQQRGDLVQRIKANRLALDLTQIYGPGFATDLWWRLAEVFRFEDVAAGVIDADALRALGEIAARIDLASGPRTVVDVLKIAAARHQAGAATPYGMLDLIGSFERGEVAFDGLSRIQAAVQQALADDLVRGNPERERAVRLMAAFPSTGLSLPLQVREGVRDAVDDLHRLAGGELVAIRGGGYDHTGRAVEAGMTLLALRPMQEQVTWLKSTIRDFRRAYYLNSEGVHQLAAQAFRDLLVERLFPQPAWRVERDWEATALSQNAGVVLRGAFPSAVRRFPDRVVYCRILRPNEPEREALAAPDMQIDIALLVKLDEEVEAQRARPGRLQWLAPNHVRVELNLLRREADAVYLDLNPGFEDIVAPYDVNPLLNLSLYAHLARALTTGAVPGAEESNVRDLFLPALHRAATRDLFTADLGQSADPPIAAADERFFDALVRAMSERTYGDRYVTLMVTNSWRKPLEEYKGALQKLNNPYIQNGNEPFSGTKREVASLLTRTNATLDNFVQTFPQLIKIETPFRGDAAGRVRFTLHPLEQRIVSLIQAGDKAPRLNARTGRAVETPTITVAEVHKALIADGYRQDEIKAGLELLEARRMVEWDQRTGRIALAEPDVPSLDMVRAATEALAGRITTLRPALSDTFTRMIDPELTTLRRALNDAGHQLTGVQLLNARRRIDHTTGQFEVEIAQQRRTLAARAAALIGGAAADDLLDRPLSAPVTGGMFADQLNVVRSELQQRALTLAARTDDALAAARAAEAALAAPAGDDAGVADAASRLASAESGLAAARQRREQLRRHIDDFRAAAQLLTQARELLAERLIPRGTAAADQRDALHRWSADITGEIAAHRVEALAQVSAWQARLAEIRQQASAFEQSLRESFAARQTALRSILTEQFHVRADLLPAPLVFNPADPEESERLLVAAMRDALGRSRDRLLQTLDGIADHARDQSRPEQLVSLPAGEREHAIQDMGEVEASARQMAARARPALAALMDGLERQAPPELAEQARAIVALVGRAGAMHARVSVLTQRLQAVALTPDEQCAHDLLIELANGADTEADFGAFEQALKARLPAVDAWALMRTLTEKARVRPRIRLVRG